MPSERTTSGPWVIYTLSDPRSAAVRYVGVSHTELVRFHRHIAEARRGLKSHRHDWIRSLLSAGMTPAYSIVEAGEGPGWASAEIKWIAYYRESGCDLTNLTAGGEGNKGYIPNRETRERMAAAKRGRPRTAETREKIGIFFRGRKLSAEHVAKVAAKVRGHVVSSEARAKISKAKLGKPGRPMSAETRRKISAAHLARRKVPDGNNG